MFVLAVVWLSDVGAYFVGCNWGRHKITPRLSPNKTIEGTFGGFVFAVLTALIIRLILPSIYGHIFTMKEVILLGAFFGIASQIGDLVESAFKRDAGVKDSGRTHTGHGGILDLIDSVIFSLPLMYLYLYFFKHFFTR